MRGGAALLAGIACAAAACRWRSPDEPIAVLLERATVALFDGRIEDGAELIAAARRRAPDDLDAARWSAIAADLLWHDEEAIREQLAAIRLARTAGRPAAEVDELRGRLGDLLFHAGRWNESIEPLRAGAALGGPSAPRRAAFAELASELPFRRSFLGPIVAEHPLLPGAAPEFVCGTDDRLRPFAIDSGTSMTTIAATFAAELGVAVRRAAGEAVDGTGRALPVEVGLLPDFQLGSIEVGSVPVLIVGDDALNLGDLTGTAERVPRGVLGLDLLAACRMTVDPERGSVVLELPYGLPPAQSVQCVRSEGRCLLPVEIEGSRLWFVLDTGASHSSLTDAGVAALPGGGARAVPTYRRVHGIGGLRLAVRAVRDLVLRCSDARFLDVELPVVPRVRGEWFPVHGVLGVDLLSRCQLTLDQGRARLTALP